MSKSPKYLKTEIKSISKILIILIDKFASNFVPKLEISNTSNDKVNNHEANIDSVNSNEVILNTVQSKYLKSTNSFNNKKNYLNTEERDYIQQKDELTFRPSLNTK